MKKKIINTSILNKKEGEKMNPKTNLISSAALIEEKEIEFASKYANMTFSQICSTVGIPAAGTSFSTLSSIMDEVFLDELCNDKDFLNLKVLSHFVTDCDCEALGLSLCEVYDYNDGTPIDYDWFALIIADNEVLHISRFASCSEDDIIKDSPYTGKTLLEALELLTQYRALDELNMEYDE